MFMTPLRAAGVRVATPSNRIDGGARFAPILPQHQKTAPIFK